VATDRLCDLEDSACMAMDVEIELRVPSLTQPKDGDAPKKVINNTSVRFRKVIQVPSFPQPGSTLQLDTNAGTSFECTINRADWHAEKDMFVLSCRYVNKRITQREYDALLNDPAWQMTLLPE
jgi:hypothetical protein